MRRHNALRIGASYRASHGERVRQITQYLLDIRRHARVLTPHERTCARSRGAESGQNCATDGTGTASDQSDLPREHLGEPE